MKGIPSRYKPAALTEKHWCPVCQCQSDPGKQFMAIVENNMRLAKETTRIKESQRDLIKAAEELIVYLALHDVILKIRDTRLSWISSKLEEAIKKARGRGR